ncbi:MAG TPA: hypothetical protein VKD91_05445 [Pyrinomonadaceae bacterium]|nr:hypothetical protein [Pyrinomonadaceae bacterium]
MNTIKLWLTTIRTTFTNVGALAVFALIYALLVATFFKFIWTREATVWQVFITYSFMVLIPAEFFIYQAAIIDRVRDRKFRWGAILVDAIKFFIVTIPVLLLAWLLYYLLNKIAGRFPAPIAPAVIPGSGPAPPQPIHWPSFLFSTLRLILFGVALPLTTIHLWIAVAGTEVRVFLRRIGATCGRAFAFESVLIYGLGLIFFVLVPYAILFIPFTPRGNKTDFTFFILRLLLVFVFSFFGWLVTISALTKNSLETPPAPAPDKSPAVAVEAAA